MPWRRIIFNISFFLNCLLVFLLIVESYLMVPSALQVLGRMHPLFLHLPIGLLILFAACELFLPFHRYPERINELRDGLLLATLLCVSLTAVMGLFLSREPGYESGDLSIHKWAGAISSLLLLAWYQFRYAVRSSTLVNKSMAAFGILAMIVTGHMGGNITHGENFVLGPVLPEKEEKIAVALEDAIVYTHIVQPILESKCVSCHNERKAKGELVMETAELLLKGGKNGKLWDTTAPQLGLMLQRVHLPLDDEDHMPPKGKPQLTDVETEILEEWIKTGSSFTMKVLELPAGNSIIAYAETVLSPPIDQYKFASAEESDLQALNSFYRIVQPISENSPALTVTFFGSNQFDPKHLDELKKVREQVVSLDLSRMPVKDEHLSKIAEFSNLRTLSLNFTMVEGKEFDQLDKLTFLRELSLSGNQMQPQSLNKLSDHPSLKKIFIWNSGVSPEQAAALAKSSGKNFEAGYHNDTTLLKLTPPILQHEKFVFSSPVNLKLKHNINGAQIRYTTDGTEPDSIRSNIYSDTVKIYDATTVKAKVFREGWLSSDIITARFYIGGRTPSTVTLLTAPDPKYKGTGSKTLFDLSFGGESFINGNWLGYQSPSKFAALLAFENTASASSITFSGFQSLGSHIFPPTSITVWYGTDSLKLKKLETIRPDIPAKDDQNKGIFYVMNLPAEPFKYLKVEAVPINRLPSWHPSKGQPGWVFFDEIIIN